MRHCSMAREGCWIKRSSRSSKSWLPSASGEDHDGDEAEHGVCQRHGHGGHGGVHEGDGPDGVHRVEHGAAEDGAEHIDDEMDKRCAPGVDGGPEVT